MAYNPKWNVFNRIIDGDTRISLSDGGTSEASIVIDGTHVADFQLAGLAFATGGRVNEFSTDGTLAGDLDTSVPTEKAVKTYVDNAISNLNPDKIWQDDSYVQVVDDGTNAGYVKVVTDGVEVVNVSEAEQTFGSTDDTHISILDGTATVPAGSVQAFSIEEDGIGVELGATINEFSTDGTLAGDSDTALPTEQAVKTYVDTQISSASYQIIDGDSYVRVNDATGGEGNVEVVVDGVQVQYWDDEATTIRMGKASAAGRVTVTDTEVTTHVGSSERLSITAGNQVIGNASTDSIEINTTDQRTIFYTYGQEVLRLDPTGNGELKFGTQGKSYVKILDNGGASGGNIDMVVTANQVLLLQADSQTLGISGDSRIDVSQADDTVDIYAGATQVMDLATTQQVVGVLGSSRIVLSQAASGNLSMYAGATQILNASPTIQRFGAAGDTALTVDNNLDTFTLSAGANTHISGTLTSLELGVNNDTTIVLDQSADNVTITAGGESQLLIETSGVSVYEDLTVTGNLYVDGTTWVVHNQEVTTSDNLIVINNGEVGPGVTAGHAGFEIDRGSLDNYYFMFSENTDTFRIGESADGTSFVGLQAVATREDSPTDMIVPWWNDTSKSFETAGSSSIAVNTTTDVITFTAASSPVATFESDGLTLASGTNINEFSTDGTLGDDSDNAVPTEAAVKAYVDAQIGGSSNWIFEGDSFVRVVDDTTAAGYIEVVADGVQVQYWDAEATTIRMGKASGAGRITLTDTSIVMNDEDDDEIFNVSSNIATLGTGGASGSHYKINYGSHIHDAKVNNSLVFRLTETVQTMGVSGATNVVTSQSGTSVYASANNVLVLDLSDTTQRIGASAASNIELTSNNISLEPNNVITLAMSDTQQTLGVAGDTAIVMNTAADNIAFTAGTTAVGNFNASGLQLGASGARVTTIATSTALGTSDTTLVTQNAVKTYVDTEIANIAADQIISGDSYVKVVDDGTNAGYVTIVADGVEVAHYDAEASSQRMGKASGAGRVVTTDTTVTGYVASDLLFSLDSVEQWLGDYTATALITDQTGAAINLKTGGTSTIALSATSQRIGVFNDTNITLSQGSNSFTFTAANAEVASLNDSGLQLGGSGARVTTIATSTALGTSDTTLVTQGAVKAYVDAQISGGLDVIEVYSDTTAVAGDVLVVDTTAGNVTITLEAESDALIRIKKITSDSNSVIVQSSGLVDGLAASTIAGKNEAFTYICDGTDYYVF